MKFPYWHWKDCNHKKYIGFCSFLPFYLLFVFLQWGCFIIFFTHAGLYGKEKRQKYYVVKDLWMLRKDAAVSTSSHKSLEHTEASCCDVPQFLAPRDPYHLTPTFSGVEPATLWFQSPTSRPGSAFLQIASGLSGTPPPSSASIYNENFLQIDEIRLNKSSQGLS